nr:response regulator [Kibdelosporangium sp. MJ126-NF4]CEL23000.1 putative two-component system sensor kinase [Kibdelosporangium sp. MJ126-NF4]CTQ90140.1 putative two-component system sensor kinase [Kibdelosporangium sp. MJ126-NF4]
MTIRLSGNESRVCGPCRDVTVAFLVQQGVPAESLEVSGGQEHTTPATAPVTARTKPTRVVLIEDDDRVGTAVCNALTKRGYHVKWERTGHGGMSAAYLAKPDVILLDLGLPDIDGIELLRQLRLVSDVPVIVASARGEIDDRILGLTAGADDYLVKPFSVDELCARIGRTQHNRGPGTWAPEIYDDGLLRLDSARLEARVADVPLDLTPLEFRLLETLARQAGKVQPMATLLVKAWHDTSGKGDDRVKFAVSRLRGKLGSTALGSESIVSVRSVGYLYQGPHSPVQTEDRASVLEDRDRIARDLHDLVIQRLFAIGLGLQALAPKASAVTDHLLRYVDDLDTAIQDIRETVYHLQDRPIGAPNLRGKVLRHAGRAESALGFAPRVVLECPVDTTIADDIEHDLFAALGEGLSNVARHARATAVDVILRADRRGRHITLYVIDNGVGMPENVVRRSGLGNLETRARRWGGQFIVADSPGGGTALTWTASLPA